MKNFKVVQDGVSFSVIAHNFSYGTDNLTFVDENGETVAQFHWWDYWFLSGEVDHVAKD